MPPRKSSTPDILKSGLAALFVGINPGLMSARLGHNFANPANGFWRLMHESGLLPRRLRPEEEMALLDHGLGLTNLVGRETRGVMDLSREEMEGGRRALLAKIRKCQPLVVVFVGITVYRSFFGKKPGEPVACGEQAERIDGARVFVVPNPSGRNAHFSHAQMLEHFRAVALALGRAAPPR
jgi:TDG/mug DNA glycosylase family protein